MVITSPFHTTVSGGTTARPSSNSVTPPWLMAIAVAVVCGSAMAAERLPIEELDAFWNELSRSVTTGDFEACVACYHPDGVLVSEAKERSEPITAALARWKQEFADTRDRTMKAEVVTRFTRRLGDATTAHETGIFRYTSQKAGEEPKVDYVPFESLCVKRDGRWLMLMEYQKAHVTKADWDALAEGT